MKVEELLEMTVLLEHLNGGGKKSCKQVNTVYSYLPDPKEKLATKKQKIRAIQDYWNKLADETIAKFLIERQRPKDEEK